MATLNIKGFPDALYRRLQAQAKREHRSLAQQVTRMLSEAAEREQHSIFELEGLGEDFWRGLGVDAAEYVRRERESWA